MQIVAGNALWQLVLHSDVMSKVVILVLLAVSIVCWTIACVRIIGLRAKNKNLISLKKNILKIEKKSDLYAAEAFLPAQDCNILIKKVISLIKIEQPHDASGWESIAYKAHEMVDDFVAQDEQYVPFLSTSAAVATLIGLFGTVWGLIHSFVRISERQTADIVTVAPGIAEALITTLAGLLVAIPALVLFHYLVSVIQSYDVQLRRVVDHILWIAHKQKGE